MRILWYKDVVDGSVDGRLRCQRYCRRYLRRCAIIGLIDLQGDYSINMLQSGQ